MTTAKTSQNTLTREEYRQIAYKDMGFTPEQATLLSKVAGLYVPDVRDKYLDKGCSPELAFRILSP